MERLTEKVFGFAQIKECGNDFCKETCAEHDEEKSCNNCPIQKAIEKLTEYEDLEEQGKLYRGWIPCSERLPETDDYILVSFENFTIADIGRYEMDEEGGAFYPGDDDKSYVSHGLFVNAWQPLPKPYKLEEKECEEGEKMGREILFRAKHIHALPLNEHLDGTWIEGYLCNENHINSSKLEGEFLIDPETICRCTGKEYMNCEVAYEGDIFESQSCGLRMVLKYGTYQAYCPEDGCYVDSVGFYADAIGYQQMPIGDLKDYALKIGNIFDNPELLEEHTE